MKSLDDLIYDTRLATINKDTNNISDNEFVRYANDGQAKLQSSIFQSYPESNIFAKEVFLSINVGQEAYSLPDDIYAQNAVVTLEISNSSIFFPLKRISDKERRTGYGYILRDKQFLLEPTPQNPVTNGVRLVYIRKLPTLDIRRGKITSFTSTSVNFTSDKFDASMIDNFFCVVDRDGVIKQSGLRIENYSAGVITTVGLTNAAAGDYLVLGSYCTTHSQAPDTCERYLFEYMNMRSMLRDSSQDAQSLAVMFKTVEDDIIGLFKNNVIDSAQVPVSNTDYMIW